MKNTVTSIINLYLGSFSCIVFKYQWVKLACNYKHSYKLNYYAMFLCQRLAFNYSVFHNLSKMLCSPTNYQLLPGLIYYLFQYCVQYILQAGLKTCFLALFSKNHKYEFQNYHKKPCILINEITHSFKIKSMFTYIIEINDYTKLLNICILK